jgi:hypothetical protein
VGLVVRHGDGTLIYAYVQFEEESITGLDVLVRSGLALAVAPFGGLGGGVCSLDGEGCPADDCWCASYSTPAYFWHYYARQDGNWNEQLIGASSRVLHDGDIDGWSWTADASGLPDVTIDEIALLNGVDRNAPTETPTSPPTPTPEPPTPTPTPEPPTPTAAPPTPTPEPPLPTATPSAVPASPTSAPSPTPTPEITATSTPPIALTATPQLATPVQSVDAVSGTRTTTASNALSQTATATRPPATRAAEPVATDTPAPTSLAVKVEPGGTPVPLDLSSDDGGGSATGYVVFAAMAAVVVAAGAAVVLRGRRA